MIENYTRMVNDRCFDMVDYGIITVWNEIENTPEDTDAERWRKKLEQIARHFAFSSRFALVRLLYTRTTGENLDSDLPVGRFSFSAGTQTYTISDISSEHIASLAQSELSGLEQLLMELACARPDHDPVLSRQLISRALRDSASAYEASLAQLEQRGMTSAEIKKGAAALRKESKTLLTRQEAMQLGHILGMSFHEMSWFLLRVFDFEEGFRYRSSEDLIDAFGFLTDAALPEVARIKQEFAALRADAQYESRKTPADNWTRAVSVSFPRMVEAWPSEPEQRRKRLLGWLMEQLSLLDQPSETATEVYRRLAAFAVGLIRSGGTAERDSFFGGLQAVSAGKNAGQADALLCENGSISAAACKKASADLLEQNKELFTAAPDRAKAWRTVTVSEVGLPRLIMAGRPDAGRNRVQDLLSGTVQAEKGDLLHLLWFTFNLFWMQHPIYSPNDIFNALADFTENAQTILNAALLPPFYPPHIMEQSMMLSIVLSGEETGVPADVYAEICESLILPRNRSHSVG